MPRKRPIRERKTVTCRCHLCGDAYDDWADRLSDAQAAHETPEGTCPGCREALAVEHAARYRARFGQRENKPVEYTQMEDGYRDRWNRATGRGA